MTKHKHKWQFVKYDSDLDPEHYYVNERLYRSPEDLKIFEKELEQQIKDLMGCYKTNSWYRNAYICKKINCWYEKYCVNPKDLDIFYKRREDSDKCFSVINKKEVKKWIGQTSLNK